MIGAAMRRSARWLLLAIPLLMAAVVAPVARAGFDDLPGETLGDTPYASAAEFDATAPSFDTSGFGEQQAEIDDAPAYLACGGWGAKTAWVRFATAVKGNLRVNAFTELGGPGDIFYTVYTAPTTSPSFGDLTFLACQDGFDGPEETYAYGHEVPANTVVFVQVLMQCNPSAECGQAEREAAPGGPTTVRLRFKPANADGDSFPDSVDACPSVAGAFRGCPDSDGDGVGDAEDACPHEFGRAANGCRRPDEDGDGHASTALGGDDCNDDDPAIHPGARDIPHDGIDQNCDGHDARYPRLRNEVGAVGAWSPRLHRTVGFLAPFTVGGPLVRGMVVRLRCQGRGCPISRQAVKVRSRHLRQVEIGRRLARRTLFPGARVTLTVSRRGWVGEAMRYTIRRRGKVRVETLCTQPGETKLRRKCG